MVKLNVNIPDGYLKDTQIFYNDNNDSHFVKKEFKELWAISIDLIKELERVCNKLNIKFFADSGTLLGTVRHKGFIPWDNDVDVAMLREDYDKLLANAHEFQAPYFLQTPFTDKYFDTVIKLRRTDTTGYIPQDKYLDVNKGVFIDIYVIDKIPDDLKERKKFFKKLNKLSVFGVYKSYYIRKFLSLIFKKDILSSNKRINKLRKKYTKLDNFAKKYSNSDCKYGSFNLFVEKKNKRKILPLQAYNNIEKAKFEFTDIYVPGNTDSILKTQYGSNYMVPQKLPTAHGSVIFDADKPFKK